MFGVTIKIKNEVEKVRLAGRDAARGSFSRAAFLIRQTAVQSVERAEGPSTPGSPVHTHRGNWFRRAIRYSADKEGAVIGPMFSVVGTVGQAHEFGGDYKGNDYPQRPTMGPALEQNLDAFASNWNGSISPSNDSINFSNEIS